ncbi:uncharacterized protein LOC131954040 [Physella acuta]|uniref:uncharacterized protein LOC131954040 n=1 Tax=Physella acuta TaxID=109671 RepID=UPI0027DCCD54|nr:uncharacterized protein LOC131954040 [Physella acuta]
MVLVPLLATTPAFVGFRIGLTFDPSSNSSMLGLVAETSSGLLETISLLTNVFIQFLTYFLVMGFASGLIKVFLKNSEWRKSTSTASQNSSLTSRDTRLVKVIALISAVFVVCSTPAVLGSVAMMLVREFSVTGRYKNLFVASFSTFFLLESVNATVNFFIYLNTSSKFKVELGSMIGLKLK